MSNPSNSLFKIKLLGVLLIVNVEVEGLKSSGAVEFEGAYRMLRGVIVRRNRNMV
jgi:hypothetical protein